MEVIGAAASVIAIIQVADRIIGLCKAYLEAAHNAPWDLRAILIEISSVKAMLDNLLFLRSCNHGPTTLDILIGDGGPVEGCRRTMSEIERLFPPRGVREPAVVKSKRQEVKTALAALAWPLKERKEVL